MVFEGLARTVNDKRAQSAAHAGAAGTGTPSMCPAAGSPFPLRLGRQGNAAKAMEGFHTSAGAQWQSKPLGMGSPSPGLQSA